MRNQIGRAFRHNIQKGFQCFGPPGNGGTPERPQNEYQWGKTKKFIHQISFSTKAKYHYTFPEGIWLHTLWTSGICIAGYVIFFPFSLCDLLDSVLSDWADLKLFAQLLKEESWHRHQSSLVGLHADTVWKNAPPDEQQVKDSWGNPAPVEGTVLNSSLLPLFWVVTLFFFSLQLQDFISASPWICVTYSSSLIFSSGQVMPTPPRQALPFEWTRRTSKQHNNCTIVLHKFKIVPAAIKAGSQPGNSWRQVEI